MQQLKILVVGQQVEAIYEQFVALDSERFALTIVQGYTDETTYEDFSKRVQQYSEVGEDVIVYTIQSNERWKEIDEQTLKFLRGHDKRVVVLQVGQASISEKREEEWAKEQVDYVNLNAVEDLNSFLHQLGERQVQFAELD